MDGSSYQNKSEGKIKKIKRFIDADEEEILRRTLPDYLANDLDILIIGINPGLSSAYKGHHYAGHSNHFWKCLNMSGLTPQTMTSNDDFKLIKFGIGFTNVVPRTTKSSVDLDKQEIKNGCETLLKKLQMFKPKIAVFNGKLIFEIFSGKKKFCFGLQQDRIKGTGTYIWVMPSSSARSSHHPSPFDKLPYYKALKEFRDYLNGELSYVNKEDFVFPCKSRRKEERIEVKSEYFHSSTITDLKNRGEQVIQCPAKKQKIQEEMELNLKVLRSICQRN